MAAGAIFLLWPSQEAGQLGVAKPRAVASFYTLAHFTEIAASGRLEVLSVAPAGADSHDFEPTPRDIKKAASSELFVYLGGGFDPWAARIAPELEKAGVKVIEMAASIPFAGAGGGHVHEDEPDPHIWLDPELAAGMVRAIADALASVDPEGGDAYKSSADSYAAELMKLDAEFWEGLGHCKRRKIVVTHDAYGYLARRYGLSVVPLSGVMHGAEPSARRVADVAAMARKEGIRHIFTEPMAGPGIAGTVAREAGAEVLTLSPIEGLSAEDARAGKDYLTLMRENLSNLRKALECR